jgi:allophanate hydrolase
VLVAAGVAAFSLGSDTAGSGRVPAAFNHLIGLKPTKGRWSTRGVMPACRSLDCVSIFANDVADAALVDGVLAAFDAEDVFSRAAEAPLRLALPRIGVARADQLDFSGDGESAALFESARNRIERLGGGLAEVDIQPLLDCAQLLYSGPWVAERAVALKAQLAANPSAVHPVVRGIVSKGADVSAVAAFEGFYALKGFERGAEALWREIDVLVLPTAPTIFRIADVRADPVALNSQLGRYTNFVNLLDLAAITVPAGFRPDGLPFGITLIGPAGSDAALGVLAGKFAGEEMHRNPVSAIRLAVLGAHLSGMALNHQLTERRARLVRKARTAPTYRLYALEGKPGLVRAEAGGAIELEVWELEPREFGSFVAQIPAPLGIGTLELEDGEQVKGFLCEPYAVRGRPDITQYGGWRAYLEGRPG